MMPVLQECALVLVSGGALAWGTMVYGATHRRAQVFGRSIHHGSGKRRVVALTFDDGPSPGTTELARYLEEVGVRATFFMCGVNVLRHPEIGRALYAAGHELGNHSFTHRRLCPRIGWKLNLMSPRAVYREFADAQEAIFASTGARPRLLRAPYGLRWWGVGRAQRKLGLTGVMWTVIGRDWEWSAERVAKHVLGKVSPGAIVCLHDGRDTRTNPDISATLGALQEIVVELRRRGYDFVTVSDLM